MTNYPYGFDNHITLPGVSGSSQEDTAISALREATFAIETELGITPSGIYTDVRARLDILENRLNGFVSPIYLGDGYVNSPIFIVNPTAPITLTISDGVGVPTENRIDGSLYMRGGDGYANNQLYIRLNAQWYPIQTDQWVAGNDLAGTYLNQTVIGLYNHPLNSAMDSIGPVEDGYHLTWNDGYGYWEAQTGFIPGHDLLGFSGPYGRTGQTVIGLQGYPISGVAPTDGYTLVWVEADNRWEPQARAVIFDGYVSRVNLRSNRYQQSPIDNTKTGIVNLGTSTDSSGGALANYSTILGGDRSSASGNYSTVVGGFANSALDGYTIVINGNANSASGAQSTVINGISNIVSGNNSIILSGTNNDISGDFSSILNGNTNSISTLTTHSLIGLGTNNQITGGTSSNYSIIVGGNDNVISSSTNAFVGAAATASVEGNYAAVLSGVNNIINILSDYAIILSGHDNTVSVSSEFSFIGSGNNNTVTGHHAAILSADTSVVDALHGLIVNGSNNSVTGDYSTILNGDNNNITLSSSYGAIIDGYNNTVSSPGGLIVDGYNNTVAGQFSSIINGNFNTISGRNSTILNGAGNSMDSNSTENAVLVGNYNIFANCNNAAVIGTSNILTDVSNHFVVGALNTSHSTFSFINGSLNTLDSGSSFNRIFGSSNILNSGTTTTFVVGNSNQMVNGASTNIVLGSNNIVDGYNSSLVHGSTNIVNADFTAVSGQYGKTRMFGQQVQANSRFTSGKIGEVQSSKLILTGTSNSGNAIPLQLQDGGPSNITLADGYSYEMNIRVMIVNTAPLTTNPVVPARFVFDVLAHQESTTIAVGSNGASLPQPIINVASTSGFLPSGTIFVTTDLGVQEVTYTGTTGTSFTGCTGGSGVMSTGGIVRALVLDNINETVSTTNTADDPAGLTRTVGWSVTLSAFGDQFLITVDPEISAANYVQPQATASDRRAVATVEWRELSRV